MMIQPHWIFDSELLCCRRQGDFYLISFEFFQRKLQSLEITACSFQYINGGSLPPDYKGLGNLKQCYKAANATFHTLRTALLDLYPILKYK